MANKTKSILLNNGVLFSHVIITGLVIGLLIGVGYATAPNPYTREVYAATGTTSGGLSFKGVFAKGIALGRDVSKGRNALFVREITITDPSIQITNNTAAFGFNHGQLSKVAEGKTYGSITFNENIKQVLYVIRANEDPVKYGLTVGNQVGTIRVMPYNTTDINDSPINMKIYRAVPESYSAGQSLTITRPVGTKDSETSQIGIIAIPEIALPEPINGGISTAEIIQVNAPQYFKAPYVGYLPTFQAKFRGIGVAGYAIGTYLQPFKAPLIATFPTVETNEVLGRNPSNGSTYVVGEPSKKTGSLDVKLIEAKIVPGGMQSPNSKSLIFDKKTYQITYAPWSNNQVSLIPTIESPDTFLDLYSDIRADIFVTNAGNTQIQNTFIPVVLDTVNASLNHNCTPWGWGGQPLQLQDCISSNPTPVQGGLNKENGFNLVWMIPDTAIIAPGEKYKVATLTFKPLKTDVSMSVTIDPFASLQNMPNRNLRKDTTNAVKNDSFVTRYACVESLAANKTCKRSLNIDAQPSLSSSNTNKNNPLYYAFSEEYRGFAPKITGVRIEMSNENPRVGSTPSFQVYFGARAVHKDGRSVPINEALAPGKVWPAKIIIATNPNIFPITNGGDRNERPFLGTFSSVNFTKDGPTMDVLSVNGSNGTSNHTGNIALKKSGTFTIKIYDAANGNYPSPKSLLYSKQYQITPAPTATQ